MSLPAKNQIVIGNPVQVGCFDRSGDYFATTGDVQDILTNADQHPHGIKVRLTNGLVGRVKALLDKPTQRTITLEVTIQTLSEPLTSRQAAALDELTPQQLENAINARLHYLAKDLLGFGAITTVKTRCFSALLNPPNRQD